MLHGLSLPFQYNYDMPFEGESAADLMAAQGIECYMMSALGYGLSDVPSEGFNRFADWKADVLSVIDHLGFDRISILGWSGSAVPALAVAAEREIDKLIIYGFPDFEPGVRIMDPRPNTHRTFSFDGMRHRRYKDIPDHLSEIILPDSWYSAWEQGIRSSMPITVPLGTEWDRAQIKLGESDLLNFYDPSRVTCDCLLTTGVWDTDVHLPSFHLLFREIASKRKYFRLAKDSTHWALMETNRSNIVNIMCGFLLDR